ncbi:MAG: response regulator transcription factor [Bacteroidota bacterium]
MKQSSIHLGIVDDELLFRKGLRALISEREEIEVILEAGNGQELLDQLREGPIPDVLLLDLNMPVLSGVETTKALQKSHPEIRIIILTTHYSKGFIVKMIELGAASYLPKNSEPEEVAETVLTVAAKGFYYNDHVMNVIRENMQRKVKRHHLAHVEISSREKEVLQLICEQYTTAEIATKLFISPRTVDGHRNNLLEKTGARNTAGLVVFALENKVVELTDYWG